MLLSYTNKSTADNTNDTADNTLTIQLVDITYIKVYYLMGGDTMAYFDNMHKNRIDNFNIMWSQLTEIEELASNEYSIGDLAQDNNLKLLQTLILFDFQNQSGREGSDAFDRYGNAWELKTCNSLLVSGFSTNHHTNIPRIEAFRQERWLFSIYEGINLVDVYAMSPRMLEPFFSKWEAKILSSPDPDTAHINNPKIPIKFIRQNGIKVYPFTSPALDPAEVLRDI